ncbi:GNAT family N-acetyltransferase [Tuwongella immobilis]|uniref:N-acetyltransferase domain-containing protein n=1 Tax=Tuwongella immobilis TaxID=692036 RepID=A0A6C2YUE1_9BACT|nr:GNAT family N-acetyltransferase [Tuwongella immobilis]VIP04535.1 gcn5-related n-acetyltransferase : Uncharacterized conserved protein OS=Janthinobacterium sp. (strain Marseille) GN=mma_0128 PE=4 SV=1: Acetyltransf_3 [Tuwongella immobilis]VTS06431.1 gcn5-related n-acetyltransferase : Uncharacterized conserved protein OS=Janthinobacterium sp. (strain Marseille) GN=mma_0128 PE=4 SV=1: Acetyltransf_3 [Tuwongella immobilis]
MPPTAPPLDWVAIPESPPQLPSWQGHALAEMVVSATQSLTQQVGYVPPWIGYLVRNSSGEWVGTCGFKSPPQSGQVEIAYFTFPEFEGRGIATAMARRLLELAQAADPAVQVIAQTLPMESPSTSILRKLGFRLRGTVHHPDDGDVWEWEQPQPSPGDR